MSDYKKIYLNKANIKGRYVEQLAQCVRLVQDGDLISKSDRDLLVDCKLISRANGYNVITDEGIKVLHLCKILP